MLLNSQKFQWEPQHFASLELKNVLRYLLCWNHTLSTNYLNLTEHHFIGINKLNETLRKALGDVTAHSRSVYFHPFSALLQTG